MESYILAIAIHSRLYENPSYKVGMAARARIVGLADDELFNFELIVFVFECELSLISHELKPLATLYCIILNCRR